MMRMYIIIILLIDLRMHDFYQHLLAMCIAQKDLQKNLEDNTYVGVYVPDSIQMPKLQTISS